LLKHDSIEPSREPSTTVKSPSRSPKSICIIHQRRLPLPRTCSYDNLNSQSQRFFSHVLNIFPSPSCAAVSCKGSITMSSPGEDRLCGNQCRLLDVQIQSLQVLEPVLSIEASVPRAATPLLSALLLLRRDIRLALSICLNVCCAIIRA